MLALMKRVMGKCLGRATSSVHDAWLAWHGLVVTLTGSPRRWKKSNHVGTPVVYGTLRIA